MNLTQSLFWDTSDHNIDWEKHSRYVIQRVVTRGSIQDWWEIKKYYGLARIENEILSIRNLDKKTLNFFSVYFTIPKQKFRCYIMKRSSPGHWNY